MKKKKIFFICSACICIILSIYSILNINSIRQTMLETVANYPEIIVDRITSIYSKTGIYLIPNILCIIFSILIFTIAYKDKLSEYKGFIIGFSITSILIGENSIVSLISFINLIVAISIKGQTKKNIPDINKNNINIIKIIFLLILYFSQILIPNNNIIISILLNILILASCILIFFNELKQTIKIFFRNFRTYIYYIFPKLGIMYIIYFIISFICIFALGLGVSENQKAIEAMPIYYTLPLATLYAPIVEEIIFRGCLKKLIKNNIIYIILSGVIFGLLHTIGQSSLYEVFIMMIPYGILGSFFAYLYTKTNNICTNIFCHFFHNSIAMLILLMSIL